MKQQRDLKMEKISNPFKYTKWTKTHTFQFTLLCICGQTLYKFYFVFSVLSKKIHLMRSRSILFDLWNNSLFLLLSSFSGTTCCTTVALLLLYSNRLYFVIIIFIFIASGGLLPNNRTNKKQIFLNTSCGVCCAFLWIKFTLTFMSSRAFNNKYLNFFYKMRLFIWTHCAPNGYRLEVRELINHMVYYSYYSLWHYFYFFVLSIPTRDRFSFILHGSICHYSRQFFGKLVNK